VAVPANPASADGEVEQQLTDASVSIVVAPDASAGARAAERLGLPRLGLSAFRAMEALPPVEPAECAPSDDIAVLLYTGGTTGVPKGAMLTHQNIVTNTVQFAEWYAFAPGEETSVCAIPMYHRSRC
jgi:acyl-CoA synthetase (AMP-forming)/AMP-acid ligase II